MNQELKDKIKKAEEEYLEAILKGKRNKAYTILADLFKSGVDIRQIDLNIIASAQKTIGQMWQFNQLSLADEHQATAIAQDTLSKLHALQQEGPRVNKTVIVACVEGEQHDMGGRIVADILDGYGFDVAFLGANCPAWALVPKISDISADAVLLGCTMITHFPAMYDAIIKIRASHPHPFPIVLAGEAISALNPNQDLMGAIPCVGDAGDILELLKSICSLS